MRPKGVADAQTVEILLPPEDLSKGTLLKRLCGLLVARRKGLKFSREDKRGKRREKLCVYPRRPYRKPTQVVRKRILRPTGER